MANTTVTGRIGDQEVELINAASEATMLKLLEAMNKMAGIQSGSKPTGSGNGTGTSNAQTQAKASNDASVALSRAGTAVGKFASAIADATTSVLGFAGNILGGLVNGAVGLTKELFLGGSQVSDFTKHLAALPSILGVFGGAIHTVTQFVEKLVTSYQSLTQVGANFGYSLIGMVKAAAQSGMNLEDFSKFVIANSEKLGMLGTSVSNGAKRFGELSKGLRESQAGQRLLAMGYTVDELNDTLMTYNVISARTGRDSARSSKEIIESTAKFAEELDAAAAATGVNRRKLASSAEELSLDAAIFSAMMKLPVEKRDEFRNGVNNLISVFPEMKNLILKAIKGNLSGPEMAAMNAMMPEFIGIMQKFSTGQTTYLDTYNALIDASQEARKRIGAMPQGQLDMLTQINGAYGEVLRNIMGIASASKKSLEDIQAAADQAAADQRILNFFTSFSDIIKRFRARFAEMLVTSDALSSLMFRLEGIFSDADGTLEPLVDKLASTFESLLMEVNEFIVTVGAEGWGAAFKNAFTHLLASMLLTDEEMMGGEDGWLNNEQQMIAVQEKLKTIMIDGFTAVINTIGDIISEKAKTFWEDNKIGLSIAGAIGAGLLALFAVDKIKNLLPSFGGGAPGGGAPGGGTPGGGALSSLGGQLAQAAGWLAKGAAIGASMVAIGYGLSKLAEGMIQFEGISWESMGKAGVAITALVGAVALLGNLMSGPQIVGLGIGAAAVAAVGLALRAFPTDVLRELAVLMSTAFEGASKIIEKVFNGIGNIVTKITEMRTAVISATTEQIKQLASIPADNMLAAAKGIQAIKTALDGFAPGVFSGISQSIGGLFAPDKVGPLDKMASMGPKLEQAAVGFNTFKAAMSGFSLASLDISNNQVSNFVRMTEKFPDFNTGVATLANQANGLSSTAKALDAFNQASQNFDVSKFTFTREQLTSLADGTTKLRALAEQLRLSKEGFQKLDTQGLKNIKEGVEGLSKAFKDFNDSFINKFLPKFEETRGKTQEGLLSNLGQKLDTLNSSVASLITIETASKDNLDTIAKKKPGKIT